MSNLIEISGFDIFERLSNYDYQRTYRRQSRRKLEHTTRWILKHPDFISWLNSETSGCLWLSGISKSAIERLAILSTLTDPSHSRLRQEHYDVIFMFVVALLMLTCYRTTAIDAAIAKAQIIRRPVLYYLFDHSYRRYLTALALFESYTRQLLCYLERMDKVCPSVIVARIFEFYAPKKRRPNVRELMDEIFVPLLDIVKGITIFVDGVEECNQEEIQSILMEFRKLLTIHSCQVFISCREEVDVLKRIPSSVRIRITPEDTKADMELFIDNEVEAMRCKRPNFDNQDLLDYIKQELLKKADRM